MKLLASYSTEKFLSFTPDRQLQAIDKLIQALEQNIAAETERQRIIMHILQLCQLLKEPPTMKLQTFIRELHPALSPHQVLNKLFYYSDGAMRKDSQIPIREGDGSITINPELRARAAKISLICDNLRSVFNVGSLFRTAECLGIGQILLCGISPTPQHSNMAKTAMGTEVIVPWQHFETTADAIYHSRSLGCHIYALETGEEAKPVTGFRAQYPMSIVIGNESLGIDPVALKHCDDVLCLTQLGWKNSLNVGVAAAITLYQLIFGDK